MLSGIILAAGESHRMKGKIKALLTIDSLTFIEHIITLMSKAPIDEIIVVLGAHTDKIIEKIKDYSVKVVINNKWKNGQISSLRAGILNLSPQSEGIIFTPVDHPLVLQSTYNILCEEWKKDKTKIILPSYHMRKGHPAIFPSTLYNEILTKNLEQGARDILKYHNNIIRYVIVEDEGTVRDIDTMDDYNDLIKGAE